MLTVKTFLDRSAVHGIGLFADQFIEAGELIWEFNPLVDLKYDRQSWESVRANISRPSFQALLRYSYKEGDFIYLCLDNAQFMNHSVDECNVMQVRNADTMRASRLVKRGEELLCNYLEYSDHDDLHRMRIVRGTGTDRNQGEQSSFRQGL